jgi:drug/metabolite transporter (DMT)-like permease
MGAIGISAVGVVLMVFDGISQRHVLGNVAALGSAMGFAVFTIALGWEPSGNSLPATFFGGLYTCLALGIAATVAGQSLLIPVHDTIIAFSLGFVLLGAASSSIPSASQVVPAAELPLLALVEVVLGPIWVFLAFGEGAGWPTLLGGLIVLGALAGSAITLLLEARRGTLVADVG